MTSILSMWCAAARRLGASATRRLFQLVALCCLLIGSGQAAAQAALPDLKISALTVTNIDYDPSGFWSVWVTYTVTNVGTAPTPSGWSDTAYLSANGVLDSNSQGYPLYNASALAVGGTYTQHVHFNTATSKAPGSYTLFVKADGHTGGAANVDNGSIVEADETNNTASASATLTRPDLQISAMTVAAIDYYSSGFWSVWVTYTVTNVGPSAILGGWADTAYLSTNGALDASSQGFPLYNASPLAANTSYTQTVHFNTPTNQASGNYTLFVKADGHTGGSANVDGGSVVEANETNNTASAAITLARPDLKISGLTLNGIVPQPDGSWTINASYTVTNVGSAAATGGWNDMGYLSANGVLDSSAQNNNYYLHTATSLAPGAYYTANVSFPTTNTTAPGNYTFFMKTDGHSPGYNGAGTSNTDNGSLLEADETNNVASLPVTLARPDLKISGLTLTGIVPQPDGSWTINASYVVTNVGSVAAIGTWYDMGYLSANGVLDSSSQNNNYYLNIASNLAPGAHYTANVSFPTTKTTAPGNYTFFMKTDGHSPGYSGAGTSNTDNGSIVEADETNNVASLPVSLGRPDLKISGFGVTGVIAQANGTWTINATYTVTNVGAGAATSGWQDLGYLSSNGVLDNSSQSNNYYLYANNSGLGVGKSYTANVSFTTLSSTTPGTYTFFIKTDGHSPGYSGAGTSNTDAGAVVEADETNNVASATVTLARPDLTITSMTLGSVIAVSGIYQIPVAYTVKNIGPVPAPSGWTDMGYLSTNGVLDNNSISGNYYLNPATGLAAGDSYTIHTVFTTVPSTTAGNYTFFLKTDGRSPSLTGDGATNTDGGAIVESNETNNVASQAVYLPIPTTVAMTSSVNPLLAGQTTTLSATVSPVAATGTVSFYKYYSFGNQLIGTAPITSGAASLSTTFTDIKFSPQALIAIYSGDSKYYTSTSSQVGQVINGGVGTTTLATSAASIVSGRPLTLTATVPPAATGTVTFLDGSTSLGIVAVTSGSAALTTSALTTVGTHSLTASYGGDANFGAGVSGAVSESVTAIVKASTTTAFQAAPAFVVTGGSVDVTVTVTGSAPGGSVAIFDGASTTLATLPVVSGLANASLPLAATGSHTLSAHYIGDPYNNASVSGNVSIEVNETSTSSPGAMTWIYGYDANGNRWIDIDPNGHETDRNFDKLDRPFQIMSPFFAGTSGARATVGINYDGQDRVSSVLDPRALTTTYTLDGLGNRLKLASPDTGTDAATATYDANGNLLTRTDSRGMKTTYVYDALNRLTSASYTSGTATVYQYDGGATPAPFSAGHLTKITDESGSTAYTYDFRGNVLTKVQVVSGTTLTTTYAWGSSGTAAAALTSMTYPSGSRVNYAYDVYGRVTAVSLNPTNANGVGTNTALTLNLLSGITYNGAGAVTGWTWSDGVPYKRTFDSFGRLSTYLLGNPSGTGISAGLTRTIGYDSAAQILAYTHANSSGAQASFDQHFTYDPLGRLQSQALATTSYGYSYDASGNRTAATIGSTSYPSTVATTSNRLSAAQTPAGALSFAYDGAGDPTTDHLATYTYSARGRMATAKVSAGTVSYLYNGLDQRVIKTGPTALVPTGTAYHAYDEAGQITGEYGSGLAPVYETVYLGSLPISVLKQSGTAASSTLVTTPYNVFADQTGTPRMLTRNSDEAVVWRWDSAEAFGATGPNANPSGLGAFVYNQRFPGQVLDVETGHYYNWHRDYNPALGRYVQSDPIGLDGGSMSTFAYVDSRPLTLTDALGLKMPRNSAHCVALREKMARKNDKLDERYREYEQDKGTLPERVCSTEKLSESRRGHRTLINMEDSSLRKLEQRYADECDDGPPSPPALAAGAPGSNSYPEPPGIEAAGAAAIIATGLVVAPEITGPVLGAAAAGH